VAETCDWASQIKAQPPISVMGTAAGPLIRLAGMIFSVYVGVVATGGITARSGSTPGSGNVTLQTWDGTALASLGITKKAYSISSTTGGIPSGTYCIILRICSAHWLISLDCGN
jgi:TctA family transporter